MQVNLTSKYRTSDGRAARILAVDLKAKDPVVAAIAGFAGGESILLYQADGGYWTDEPSDADLVEIEETVRFCPVYMDCMVGSDYLTAEDARNGASHSAVGILKLTVTDGVPSVEMVETFPQR